MHWVDIEPGKSYPEATEIRGNQVLLPNPPDWEPVPCGQPENVQPENVPAEKPKRKPKTYPDPVATEAEEPVEIEE